ncbi:high nitrogen upregulated cytochrome P450 monooxygenase 2 [Marasmius fiardii PR-910]|nr:high nitrogen upregulated cytochrome P450 monooxygenase 2 [Marasmius fiardii PR-910]
MATSISLIDGVLFSVFCGLTLHFLFQKLEKTHLKLLTQLAILTPVLPSYVLLNSFNQRSWFWALLVGYSTCFTSLFISIVIYRLSPLHPLARHPGPLLAKCTKFWGMYHASTGKNHLKCLEIHRRYGPIVRTGPNELSICDIDAIPPVLGIDGLGKGPIWDVRRLPSTDETAHIAIRNTTKHLQRRRPWSKAFTTGRVKAYEPIMRNRLLQLLEILDDNANKQKGVDLSKWISCFSYDFMGDMAFGGGFELMRDGDVNGLWKLMENAVAFHSMIQNIPWIIDFLYSLPGLSFAAQSVTKKLEDFVIGTAAARHARGSALMGKDISTYLLDEESPDPKPAPFDVYANEAMLAVIAGSDTTALTLTCALYHLVCDKAIFSRLQDEVDAAFPIQSGQEPLEDSAKLTNMPFLNAVINETLRLYPAVPTGIQRCPEPGTGGKVVGSVYISEDTPVNISPFVLHRDPRYFSPDPEQFWLDRWIASDDKSVETNRTAFIPFSTGPMNCVGKSLAQLELRVVISTLVHRYDMDFDPKVNWTEEQWLVDLQDTFVFKKGKLPVVLTRRVPRE